MILVDTGVWVEHFKTADRELSHALSSGQVLGHSWVQGELALGGLANRAEILHLLGQLPQAVIVTPGEMLATIERQMLVGTGTGYVDVQLLASTLLTRDAVLWTRDRKLARVAARLGIAYEPSR